MPPVFEGVSLALFAAAFTTFLSILHDSFPYLPEEERTRIRNVWRSSYSWTESVRNNRVIQAAWNTHGAQFPNSRKRVLFAALVIAASLSVMMYPLWVVFARS